MNVLKEETVDVLPRSKNGDAVYTLDTFAVNWNLNINIDKIEIIQIHKIEIIQIHSKNGDAVYTLNIELSHAHKRL